MDPRTAEGANNGGWTTANTLDEFAGVCCEEPHLRLLSDPASFSLTHRAGRIGPVSFAELFVTSDSALAAGDHCSGYRISVLQTGRSESTHRGRSLNAGPGTVGVLQPDGYAASRWAAGSRILAVKIDRAAVEDALSDALGWQLTSQIDFAHTMPATAPPSRSWMNMLRLLYEQSSRPDNLLNEPLVGLPFVDSLVRGLLYAVDHPFLTAITERGAQAPPRTIRAAIDIIEQEAHLPTTVSRLAARTHVSVRSLQQGFQKHLGVSPMTYLRDVRLRRAHQALVEADPSSATVASVARTWGFTNVGRFARAHDERYGETPSEALRRNAFSHPAAARGQAGPHRA
jgi:AraC-like DNA-binding protein